MISKIRWATCVFAGITILVGCSKNELGRLSVYGVVTKGAVNLESGSISFLPVEESKSPSATTGIVNGKYQFDRTNGPLAGRCKVVIVPQASKKQLTSQKRSPVSPAEKRNASWTGKADVSPNAMKLNFDIEL